MWLAFTFIAVGFFFCCCGCATCAYWLSTRTNAAALDSWEQVAGTWTIGTVSSVDKFATSDSNAVLLLEGVDFLDGERPRVVIKIAELPDGATAKIIACWEDSSNYIYGKMSRSGSTYTRSIVAVDGGVETTCYFGRNASSSLSLTSAMPSVLCVSKHEIHWSELADERTVHTVGGVVGTAAINPLKRTNGRVGIGTGAVPSGTVKFGVSVASQSYMGYGDNAYLDCCGRDSAHVSEAGSDNEIGPDCDCRCCSTCDGVCADGDLPETAEVTFPAGTITIGGDDATYWNGAYAASGINDINGQTYVLDMVTNDNYDLFANADSVPHPFDVTIANCRYFIQLDDIELAFSGCVVTLERFIVAWVVKDEFCGTIEGADLQYGASPVVRAPKFRVSYHCRYKESYSGTTCDPKYAYYQYAFEWEGDRPNLNCQGTWESDNTLPDSTWVYDPTNDIFWDDLITVNEQVTLTV